MGAARTPRIGATAPTMPVSPLYQIAARADSTSMLRSVHLDPHMSTELIRDEIQALYRERRDAISLGLDANNAYMASLEADLADLFQAYAAAAVTEKASARAVVEGALRG